MRISGSERLGDVDCTLVRIVRPGSARVLWIDPTTNFILKDDATKTITTPANSTTIHTVVTFSVARAVPSVEDANDQAAFLDKFGYTFRSLVDPVDKVKNLFGAGGIPTTVLIDQKGTIQVLIRERLPTTR